MRPISAGCCATTAAALEVGFLTSATASGLPSTAYVRISRRPAASTACVAPTCGMSHAAQIAPFGYFCSNWLICAYAFCAVFGITSRSSGSMIFTFGYHFSTAFSWS